MSGRHRAPTERRRAIRRYPPIAVAFSLVATTGGVWSASNAAFSGTTGNFANRWQTGSVTFGANIPATTLFTLGHVFPGSFGSACVKLSYTGTVPAAARLFLPPASLTGTGLGPYVTLRVRDGAGTQADCSDFVASSTLYNPTGLAGTGYTVSALSTAAGTYATGLGSWAASSGNATRSYRFDWQVQDHNAAQGLTLTAAFTWQAQG